MTTFNHLMHPKNPYKDNPPDFKTLAINYPDFRKHCTYGPNGKVLLNFRSDDAVRELTRALLHKDFNLDVILPKGSLVPRVPQKLNYLLWIDDLIKINALSGDISGIDIGTGASCIYSLLGARLYGWKFVSTDVDEHSLMAASENVSRNGMESSIRVFRVEDDDMIKDVVRTFPDVDFSFCMCNPPFFEKEESEKRFQFSASDGGFSNAVTEDYASEDVSRWRGPPRPPKSTTVAKYKELAVEGGEVSFVNRIIDDSILLQKAVKIYTSMLGKKTSVVALRKRLSRIKDARFTVSSLNQGKTKRWVIAWTFHPDIVLHDGRISDSDIVLDLPQHYGINFAWVRSKLTELGVDTFLHAEGGFTRCEAKRNTWKKSRQKRLTECSHDYDEPPLKRLKTIRTGEEKGTQTEGIGCEDGRDSYTNAGNFVACEREDRTVAIQAYFPCDPNDLFLVRFSISECPNNPRRIIFSFEDGEKDQLNQLVVYLQNYSRQVIKSTCKQ